MRAYKDVQWMYTHGDDVAKLFDGIQPTGETIDYYQPSNANWSYQFKIVKFKGKLYEVMTQFGVVVGGREIILHDEERKAGL